MYLLFLRHGEATNNLINKPKHKIGEHSLTKKGIMQAKSFCTYFSSASKKNENEMVCDLVTNLNHAYTSPMLRALQTSKIIYEHIPIPEIQITPHLYEWGGIAEYQDHSLSQKTTGLNNLNLERQFPFIKINNPKEFENGWWHNKERETPKEAWERASLQLDFFKNTHDDSAIILVISHLWFINILKQQILGRKYYNNWWDKEFFEIENVGLCVFEFSKDNPTLKTWNFHSY